VCRDLELPFLDLEPVLAAAGGREQFRDGLHLTPAGNDLAAAAILEFLQHLAAGAPAPPE
jgi:hypothetical protein